MNDLFASLKENFTLVNLGCIGDADFLLPRKFLKTLTIVEIDAEGGAVTGDRYHRKISIQKPIGGRPGRHIFRRNTFAGTCSLLEPLPGAVEMWGMEDYCRLVERTEVECETVPQLLAAHNLKTLDFLKTDIEGLDPEIIRSCEGFLGRAQFIQCELRFRPFYQSEPYFQDTVNFLAEHGYEVLDILHIDRWKYRTPNWKWQLEGSAVWADFLFFLKPEKLSANFGPGTALAVAKQIILACMLGKKNHGEFLLQQFAAVLPEEWKKELRCLVRPRWFNPTLMRQSVRRQFMPLELFLKHRLNRSRHVSVRQGN